MKTEDFEKAIDALCVQGLKIDEVKMKTDSGGHVHQVNGHTDTLKVVWDGYGRAFTMTNDQEIEEFIELGSGKAVNGRRLKRDAEFDLKFE